MAAPRRRAQPADGHEGNHGGGRERWLVSYADFITLMFVVFAVLFSMAKLDASKYGTLAKSLRQALGANGSDIGPFAAQGQAGQAMPVILPELPGDLLDMQDWSGYLSQSPEGPAESPDPDPPPPPPDPDPPPPPPDPDPPPSPPPPPPDPLRELADAFQSLPGARSGLLVASLQERGLVLSIAGSVLFDPGKTTLKPEARVQLDEVAERLNGIVYPIMVEGTADEAPNADSAAMSPWDLSALRAGAVVRYLVEEQGLPGSQFVTIGFGGEGDDGNSERRVTIVVVRKIPGR